MASIASGNDGATTMEGISPTEKPSMAQVLEESMDQTGDGLDALESRVDPDNQTTVTDFLDFTEHLPSDMIRSLTLIGNLDQRYSNASRKINDLTKTWGQLPSLAPEQRPSPVQLRADISEQMNQAVSSRVFAHAEAVRMSENVNRHYNKAKALLAKLQTMMDNYPTDDAKSPVQSKSPQMVRPKLGVRAGDGGQKIRRQRVPRITVPGEVLAPYDLEYESFTDESDVSSDEESDTPTGRTPGPPRIKIVSSKPPKTPSRPARQVPFTSAAISAAAAANAAALLNPPPENAVIGSPDAPWLQLTQYELAKLRKRMKKNATWTPSETMIARELKALNRGPDAFREAKKKAEDEGKVFEPPVPKPVVDDESGTQQLPAGAISVDSLDADQVPTSNRGMKLNEAKKLKREALAKQAADEAEESARKMSEAAKRFLSGNGNQKSANGEASKEAASKASKDPPARTPKPRTYSRSQAKRKREPEPETTTETQEPAETPSARPQIKRTKTETPVPPPNYLSLNYGKRTTPDIVTSTPLLTPGGTTVHHSETPVPIPIPPRGSSTGGAATSPTLNTPMSNNTGNASNTSNTNNNNTTTTSVAIKVPPTETPVPLPMPERRKSVTPVLPPIRETPVRETIKRETRGDAAKRNQQQQQQQQPQPAPPQKQPTPVPPPQPLRLTPAPEPVIKQSSSRAPTPQVLSVPEKEVSRRPGSRGKAMSQEPQSSLAADRPRRASTARNTPAPEVRQPSKRTKRPAPGVVSVTRSGGNSAVGKRKSAPKKKTRSRKDKDKEQETYEEDDEGNPIDPNEPRYCSCNEVSFGEMIQCENSDNCKGDWFHLKCVGLEGIPARTTKWYCPECRVLLNIGEKGEVNARGVKT